MGYAKQVKCEHCDGTGLVTDYDAHDLKMGSNEVPEHTVQRHCHFCDGQGHTLKNPEASDDRA